MSYHLIYLILIGILVVLLMWQYLKYAPRKNKAEQVPQRFDKELGELKDYTRQLEGYQKELEAKVQARTSQIQELNQELQVSNEKLQAMNEYLEAKVKIRTAEVEKRNAQITEYAFITSHQLRAPLARILGLINVIELEKYDTAKLPVFIQTLANEGQELDEVIHRMNRKLEKQKERKKE